MVFKGMPTGPSSTLEFVKRRRSATRFGWHGRQSSKSEVPNTTTDSFREPWRYIAHIGDVFGLSGELSKTAFERFFYPRHATIDQRRNPNHLRFRRRSKVGLSLPKASLGGSVGA